MKISSEKRNLIIAGLIIGCVSVLLVLTGNPKNMGFCIACFIRDTAGALKLHGAAPVQYVRPEIIGLVLGSFIISAVSKEFRPKGGSSTLLHFFIGAMVMIGALMFLGCPFRMVLRLAGGDLNALVGLLGFIGGIGIGCIFLSKGFSLGRAYVQNRFEGVAFPAAVTVLLVLFIAVPSLFVFSTTGPGSMHAAAAISLAAGILVGILAQRTRLCMVGGIRDVFLLKDTTLLWGFIAIFFSALVMNLISGNFNLGFNGQPVSHTAQLWNFLGMSVVGLGSVLLGGCPLRQLILAGEGNTDSAITVFGMLVGAACAHNFGLVGNATANGPSINGKVAVISIIVILLAIAYFRTPKEKKEK